ncbi:hypothetical protein OsI_01911 [Oryza sativa Indica Group]|uniref:Uncharacterized protein n=1 Tax=Oryza sativa subsp. indica TaxID=39946 RepID=B8A7Z4_ORYSI|nr:hypothetical protein OsI_01911 [Oryza sativa Indica Group]
MEVAPEGVARAAEDDGSYMGGGGQWERRGRRRLVGAVTMATSNPCARGDDNGDPLLASLVFLDSHPPSSLPPSLATPSPSRPPSLTVALPPPLRSLHWLAVAVDPAAVDNDEAADDRGCE